MGIFLLFLLATAAGAQSTLFWIPEKDMGRGYFQLNALIVLCLLALAAAVLLLHPIAPFGAHRVAGGAAVALALAGAAGYYGGVWRERWRSARIAAGAGLVGSLGGLLLAGSHLAAAAPTLPFRGPLLVLGLVSSALLLGWSLVTMLLGHWYLISPRLSFRHLTVFCQVLVAVALLRTAQVAAGAASAAGAGEGAGPGAWQLLAGFGGQGIFFWFRLVWGLALPLGLALMSLHCARSRSNQSATGILYVVVVGAFIGEITALYLTVATGVPV